MPASRPLGIAMPRSGNGDADGCALKQLDRLYHDCSQTWRANHDEQEKLDNLLS